jgi:hypothetical protein
MVMILAYTSCGMYDEAIAEIDYLLSLESHYTVNDFQLWRRFDSLRELPEFQALMEKYALPANL